MSKPKPANLRYYIDADTQPYIASTSQATTDLGHIGGEAIHQRPGIERRCVLSATDGFGQDLPHEVRHRQIPLGCK